MMVLKINVVPQNFALDMSIDLFLFFPVLYQILNYYLSSLFSNFSSPFMMSIGSGGHPDI